MLDIMRRPALLAGVATAQITSPAAADTPHVTLDQTLTLALDESFQLEDRVQGAAAGADLRVSAAGVPSLR